LTGALAGPLQASPADRLHRIPPATTLTGGTVTTSRSCWLINGVGRCGKVGRPRQRAERLLADNAYDHDKYRRD
jgi:hypothetical protein